jgi:hypothetical protein
MRRRRVLIITDTSATSCIQHVSVYWLNHVRYVFSCPSTDCRPFRDPAASPTLHGSNATTSPYQVWSWPPARLRCRNFSFYQPNYATKFCLPHPTPLAFNNDMQRWSVLSYKRRSAEDPTDLQDPPHGCDGYYVQVKLEATTHHDLRHLCDAQMYRKKGPSLLHNSSLTLSTSAHPYASAGTQYTMLSATTSSKPSTRNVKALSYARPFGENSQSS